jgi:hypothetical protein
MTISQIKQATSETAPYFFAKSSMRFFGQRMSDFRVYKQTDGRYLISANWGGSVKGKTERYFNPINNQLEHL